MKRAGLLIAVLGLALCLPGCGFTEGTDAVVTVVRATPTPVPTPTPIPPSPTPTPEATPTPAPVIEQSPSGINVEKKNGVYTVATANLNLRTDATPDATVFSSAQEGTQLISTGVCENGWIRVDWQGQTLFASGEFVREVPAEEAQAVLANYENPGAQETVSDGSTTP